MLLTTTLKRFSMLLVASAMLLVGVYGDICTDGTKLKEIATNCARKHSILFSQATNATTEETCGLMTNKVKPCVFNNVNGTFGRICTAQEQHQMIMDFKDEIMLFLKLNISDCIPPMSCSNVDSILYFLPVICESVYNQFVQTGNCSIYLDNLNCYKDNINTTESCVGNAIHGIIKSNRDKWTQATKQQTTCPGSAETTTLSSILRYTSSVWSILRNTSPASSILGETSSASSILGDTSSAASKLGDTSSTASILEDTSSASSILGETSSAASILWDTSTASSILGDTSSAAPILWDTSSASSKLADTSSAASILEDTSSASSILGDTSSADMISSYIYPVAVTLFVCYIYLL
ncbi:mucin-22-like [Mytilus californianus]|uniref:mucin-22-like n=1 Tax=Mytilus californianus TaxID=6549 RepID=UPI002246B439|nr:mucin-22-like [Mytilus californianus]XP_052084217.1 mucin-22-like [Mytilus californianus]